MTKRNLFWGGALVVVSVLAFLAGRSSKGKGALAALFSREGPQDHDVWNGPVSPSKDDTPEGKECSEEKIQPDLSVSIEVEEDRLEQDFTETQKDTHNGLDDGLPPGEIQVGEGQNPPAPYILSTNTRKFHRPNCREVKKIRPQHYATAFTRKEAMGMNCSPCQRCKP